MRNLSLLFFVSVIMFSSCKNYYADKKYYLIINEYDQVLSQETLDHLKKIEYPNSFVFVVTTVDSVDYENLGKVANEFYKKDEKKHYEQHSYFDRAVYFFVSQNPPMVQMRMGYEIKQLSNWKGISSGEEYIKRQEVAQSGNIDEALLEMVNFSIENLPEKVNISGFKQYFFDKFTAFQFFSSFIGNLLETFDLSPDSFYTKFLLKPVLELRLKLKRDWLSYFILFILLNLTILIFKSVFTKGLFKKTSKAFKNTFDYVFNFIISLLVFIPAINSISMLRSGRLEDRIDLMNMNIAGMQDFVFQADAFNSTTPFWMALIFAVIFFFKDFITLGDYMDKSELPEAEQLELYRKFKKENPLEVRIKELVMVIKRRRRIKTDIEYGAYTLLYEDGISNLVIFTILMFISSWFFLPSSVTVGLIYFTLVSFVFGFFKATWK